MLGVGLHQKFDGQVWVNFFEVIHHWESLHWDCIGLLWSLLKYWKRKKLLDLVSNANYVFTPNEPFPSFKKKLTGASPGLRNCNIARRIPLVWHSKVELPSAINLLIFLNCCFVVFFFSFFFFFSFLNLVFVKPLCWNQEVIQAKQDLPLNVPPWNGFLACCPMWWSKSADGQTFEGSCSIWLCWNRFIFLFFSFSFFFFLFLSFQNKPVLLGLGDAL